MVTIKKADFNLTTIKGDLIIEDKKGEIVFSTEEYQEIKLMLTVLVEMVDKKEFYKRYKAKKQELKIVKELSK